MPTRPRRHGPALALLATLTPLAALIGSTPVAAAATAAPPIHHVWVVNLENHGFAAAFQSNPNPYLRTMLPAQGALLTQYHGIGHVSLDNYIAEVSGQPPNLDTQSDCQVYTDFNLGVPVLPLATVPEVAVGQGCVYPASVPALPDQLTAAGLTWRGYMEQMEVNSHGYGTACAHPAAGAADGSQSATATDQYAVRHDPFMYFHSVTDNAAACRSHVVPLAGSLASDLASVATTPSFSLITPDLCNDGHDQPCKGTDVAGRQDGGLVSVDRWLKAYVPLITASPAFRQDGMLVVTFDEADGTDGTACCGEAQGPNTADNGGATGPGPGGGRVGAVVLSPFVRPGTVTTRPYNHYSLLHTLEDVLGITTGGGDGRGHLAEAAAAGVVPFGADVYTAATSGTVGGGGAGGTTTPGTTTVATVGSVDGSPSTAAVAAPGAAPAVAAALVLGAAALARPRRVTWSRRGSARRSRTGRRP